MDLILTTLRRIWHGSPARPWYDTRPSTRHGLSPRRSRTHQAPLGFTEEITKWVRDLFVSGENSIHINLHQQLSQKYCS